MNWTIRYLNERNEILTSQVFESYSDALKSINLFELDLKNAKTKDEDKKVRKVVILNRVSVIHFEMSLN